MTTPTLVPQDHASRRNTLIGLAAALVGPLTALFGTAVALVLALVLARRGERRAAATLVLVAVVAVALLYAFATPVSTIERIDL